MVKWILGILAGLAWCGVVFVLTLWLTFPSDAIVERARYEVQKASNGDIALKADSSSPWWAGVSLNNARLVSVDQDAGTSSMMLEADYIAAQTSVFSAFSSDLPVHALIGIGGSDIVVDADLDRGAGFMPKRIDASAPTLSVSALSGLLAPLGVTLTGDGDLDLDLDLDVGKGVSEHDGRLVARGKGITLTLAMPDPISGGDTEFVLGPMTVADLDLTVDVKDGKATFKRGTLRSDLVTLELDGEIRLNEKLGRSRMQADLAVSGLGGQLQTFEPFMASAKAANGDYKYKITCSFDRFSTSCIRPDAGGSRSGRTTRPGRLNVPSAISSGAGSAGGDDGEDPTDRAARLREERRKAREERLAERRNRIAEDRAGRDAPRRPGADDLDDEDLDDEDDEFIDDEEDFEPIDPVRDRLAPELIDPNILPVPNSAIPGSAGFED